MLESDGQCDMWGFASETKSLREPRERDRPSGSRYKFKSLSTTDILSL
jgi:hypothetical protein